jgi:homogentisate 1,2-dioxygenase
MADEKNNSKTASAFTAAVGSVRSVWLAQGRLSVNPSRWTTLMQKEHRSEEDAESMVMEYYKYESATWLEYRVVERSDRVCRIFSA